MSVPAADPALEVHPPFDCARCGKGVRGEKPDEARWCTACRRALIARSSRLAWIPAIVMALLYLGLMLWSKLLESPMMAVFLALGAVLAWVAFKVGRRVFFDVLRGRPTGDGTG
jgi:hypothetical protein